jgi:hypothetical protein
MWVAVWAKLWGFWFPLIPKCTASTSINLTLLLMLPISLVCTMHAHHASPPKTLNLNPTSFLQLIEAVFNSYAVFFFGQFCDVANAAMIHKKIQHMYLINKTAFWLHITNQKKKAAKGT